MADAARDFLQALTPAQRPHASFAIDDSATRRDWGYFPRRFQGLSLGEMDGRQQRLAHRLVSTALSLHGYTKVTTIIALEEVLNRIEGRARPDVRDPGRYFLSIFGDPGGGTWAWQFEGHHISLNVTIAGEQAVAVTPLFLGSNPAEVDHAGRAVLRVMGEEEDAGRELLASLNGDQQGKAIIAPEAPPDFVLMNVPQIPERMLPGEAGGPRGTVANFARYPQEQREMVRFERGRPKGIAYGELLPAQQERFAALLDVYFDRVPEELAAIERARIHAAGIDALHFAWAGETARRQPHYYRVQGPRMLIEYDNTQDGANHIHAVWRDPDNDFGDDILREHTQQAH